jgi:hypothetical protein
VSRATTLAGFAVIALAMVAGQAVSLLSGRLPTLGQVVSLVTRRWPARWLLLAGWLWLGWHLFVRSHTGA